MHVSGLWPPHLDVQCSAVMCVVVVGVACRSLVLYRRRTQNISDTEVKTSQACLHKQTNKHLRSRSRTRMCTVHTAAESKHGIITTGVLTEPTFLVLFYSLYVTAIQTIITKLTQK